MDSARACGIPGVLRIDRGDDGFAAAWETPSPRFHTEPTSLVAVRGAGLGQRKHRADPDRGPAARRETPRNVEKGA